MSENTNTATTGRETTSTVAKLHDLDEGSMKMATVGERRIVVIRTASGVHALDNACPHQGYGLTTGSLDGDLVTCQWHNWKFDVSTGQCVMGEEDVACHRVDIVDDDVNVTVVEPSNQERLDALWPSLARGIAADYRGQIARDTARLLGAGATPAEIIASAIAHGAPRTEWGVGHELALAADCLAIAESRVGTERTLATVQALAGISEVTRDRPVRSVPEPATGQLDFVQVVESEDTQAAMAWVMAALQANVSPAEIRHQFVDAASQHHLGYGHGIIYTQKTFELLDRIGWQHASEVLPHLAVSTTTGTREDTLPYMRKAARDIAGVDLAAVAAAPDRLETGWSSSSLATDLLDATDFPLQLALDAIHDGAGVQGLLDAISQAVSLRLLRHDLDVEFATDNDFGWLDVTHGLTTARAARWAWQLDPGTHTARQALFALWLMFDTGRSERRDGVGDLPDLDLQPEDGELGRAILYRREADAIAHAMHRDPAAVAAELVDASLEDRAGSFIVVAHLVKTARAAAEEAESTGSRLPLAAAARFLAAPKLERFVARNVREAVEFVETGKPPVR